MGSKVIAVDVGGTFIDVVSVDRETGEVSVEKQPSTPDRLADELLMALGRLPGTPSEIERFLHGSTVAINALLQRTGAKVGLITTRGFRDVLELAARNRPPSTTGSGSPPEPLVPRALPPRGHRAARAARRRDRAARPRGPRPRGRCPRRRRRRGDRRLLPPRVRGSEARTGGGGGDRASPPGSPGDPSHRRSRPNGTSTSGPPPR